MSKAQIIIDFVFAVQAFASMVIAFVSPVSLEPQFIPTIVNGITSSIGLVLGFTVTTIAITISQAPFKAVENKLRISFTLMLLVFSVLMLNLTYTTLAGADLERAFRYAMIGLHISVFLLMDFIAFLTAKMVAVRKG